MRAVHAQAIITQTKRKGSEESKNYINYRKYVTLAAKKGGNKRMEMKRRERGVVQDAEIIRECYLKVQQFGDFEGRLRD